MEIHIYAWKQKHTPVAWRGQGKGRRLLVRLPFDTSNRQWLQNGRRINPEWNKVEKHWELPQAWFNDFVDRSLAKFGKAYIIQPYREQEKCAPRCRSALGHECNCSCMGQNHGSENSTGWFDVSDTFSFRWGGERIASRLLTATTELRE